MIAVAAPLESWAALLRRLPRCAGCRRPAVVRLREGGASFVVCAHCAAERPSATVEQLEHAQALDAVLAALGPEEPD